VAWLPSPNNLTPKSHKMKGPSRRASGKSSGNSKRSADPKGAISVVTVPKRAVANIISRRIRISTALSGPGFVDIDTQLRTASAFSALSFVFGRYRVTKWCMLVDACPIISIYSYTETPYSSITVGALLSDELAGVQSGSTNAFKYCGPVYPTTGLSSSAGISWQNTGTAAPGAWGTLTSYSGSTSPAFTACVYEYIVEFAEGDSQ
jgi:hypothetical protein